MCLINFQLNNHNKYKLVMAANRDEEYSRPTEAAHYWKDYPHILGGRDLRGMGTWLGITKTGRISALTNIRNTKELLSTHQKSRGHLVSNYLIGNQDPAEYLNEVSDEGMDYAGFNLLVGNQGEIFYLNNYDNEVSRVDDGLHGLSNHHLNTPWPKVIKGKTGLEKIMDSEDSDIEDLFRLLRDDDTAENKDLPDTGLSKEIEKNLSPLFINMDKYGTRCSTVILIDQDDNATFVERTYSEGQQTGEVKFEFKIEN
ncbi:NRDE family protein [Salinicoccus sp. Marseille-QA3877]